MKQIKLLKMNGLSLIEMMIALTIMVILTLVAIPTATNMLERYRAVSAADELYASLQLARAESLKRNINVFVSFSTGDTWCYGINTGSACNCTTPSSCNLGTVTASSPQELTLSATGLISNAISFEGTRGSTNTSATITYTIFGSSDFIRTSISRVGTVTSCSSGISGYSTC